MTAEQFIIDEFSTGIDIKWLDNNSWQSAGFKNKYINSTLQKIPQSIAEAIANKVFNASSTEGDLNENPAILGRLVEDWAVVVLIARAIDDKQRSLPVSRYFISKGGISALLNIIDCLENYQAQNEGRMPVFDPYEKEENFLKNYSPTSSKDKGVDKNLKDFIDQEYENFINNQSIPVILPSKKYNLRQLYILALRTSKLQKQTLSWAYNVESLEHSDTFLLIQPASQKAEENFKKPRRRISTVYQEGVNEQKLKNKIEAVVDSSGRNNSITWLKTALQEIENELNNPKITPKVWQDIFYLLGVGKFPKNSQESIHLNSARYLVLKSLIIPEEFPNFVNWYTEIKKQGNVRKACSQFLQELKEAINPEKFPKLYENLKIAIKYSLANLIVYEKSSNSNTNHSSNGRKSLG